ncbi:hypothetical protein NKG94_32340 [Micromonospora sp. M12]
MLIMQSLLSAALPDLSRAAVIWLSLLVVIGWPSPPSCCVPAGSASTRAPGSGAPPCRANSSRPRRSGSRAATRRRSRWPPNGRPPPRSAVGRSGWPRRRRSRRPGRRTRRPRRPCGGSARQPRCRSHTAQTPAEYADRERYLHRAALDAYWRRELSVEQLSDVFAHRDGWDPRLHPVEQELVLQRAVRDNLAARHAAAREHEQVAWRAAEVAVAAARSLRGGARRYRTTGRRVGVGAAAQRGHPTVDRADPENTVIARGRATVPAF